jgi:histone acetyltransferase
LVDAVHKDLKNHSSAWPFVEPINLSDAPDYLSVVSEPMDLRLIGARVKDKKYATREQFLRDVNLIFDNCRKYNAPGTVYVKCADELQQFLKASTSYATNWKL